MGFVILRDGTRIELDESQSIALAKAIMIFPPYKLMKINGVEFSVNDIDLEAERKARLPQQMGLALEVQTVEKQPRKIDLG